jgi:hypothetical protein
MRDLRSWEPDFWLLTPCRLVYRLQNFRRASSIYRAVQIKWKFGQFSLIYIKNSKLFSNDGTYMDAYRELQLRRIELNTEWFITSFSTIPFSYNVPVRAYCHVITWYWVFTFTNAPSRGGGLVAHLSDFCGGKASSKRDPSTATNSDTAL